METDSEVENDLLNHLGIEYTTKRGEPFQCEGPGCGLQKLNVCAEAGGQASSHQPCLRTVMGSVWQGRSLRGTGPVGSTATDPISEHKPTTAMSPEFTQRLPAPAMAH